MPVLFPTTLTFGSFTLGNLVSVSSSKRSVASLRRKTFASSEEQIAPGVVTSAAEITAVCALDDTNVGAVISGEGDILGATGTLVVTYNGVPARTWTNAACTGFEVGPVDAENEKLDVEVTYTFLVGGEDPVSE